MIIQKKTFNADETGIFYKILPNKTHKLKGERCSGGKMSKERITAMIYANASGTEKRKLLIIGKFQNPRCFKNINSLPIDYYWNDKAWMTSSIFTDYFKKWDQELLKEKRKILLLVNNCPAHPDVKLHIIKLFFPTQCDVSFTAYGPRCNFEFKANLQKTNVDETLGDSG